MPASDKTILILGGTQEAATMAAHLTDQGFSVITSLAGRTREPMPVKGKTRIGGFGGTEGMAAYLAGNNIKLLVDLTHPFATQISENARQAAALTRIKLIAWQRPAWEKRDDDLWIEVPNLAAAVIAIPPAARALLALGSQHIAPFAVRADIHFLVRMIDPPPSPLPLPNHELVFAKPGTMEQEFALLRDKHITHIICRNSGGKAAYAKIAAARLLKIPVLIIERQVAEGTQSTLDAIERDIIVALS